MQSPPFEFECHRSGNCCRTGHGQVWVEEQDIPAMAAARGMTDKSFIEIHLRQVGDRLSIMEGPHGRCSLLEGLNECGIYTARPEQCRTFPHWPAILEGGEGLDAAMRYCPGLRRKEPELEV